MRVAGQSYRPEKISAPRGGMRPPEDKPAPGDSNRGGPGGPPSGARGFIQHLDRNHNGYISTDEAPTGPPPR